MSACGPLLDQMWTVCDEGTLSFCLLQFCPSVR